MYFLIPFLIIIISVAIIIAVVVRKFPELSLLQVEDLPEVKEGKKKNEFLKKQVSKKHKEKVEKKKESWQPAVKAWKNFQLLFRKYVGKTEKRFFEQRLKKERDDKRASGQDITQTVRSLLKDAQNAKDQGQLDIAEKKFIDAIRLEPKNKEAYRGLGDVYYLQENLNEAMETYLFLLHLTPTDDALLVRMAELEEEKGNVEKAIQYYEKAVLINDNFPARFAKIADLMQRIGQSNTALEAIRQAVDLEPQNPKYLDNFTELAIICGNKNLAEKGLRQLRMVNPENKKLDVFKEKLAKLKGTKEEKKETMPR